MQGGGSNDGAPFHQAHRRLSNHETAPAVARSIVQSGWLPQFRVFEKLQRRDELAADMERT